MRFITYKAGEKEGVGLLTDDGYRGLPVAELGFELKDALGERSAIDTLAETLRSAPLLDRGSLVLLPPIPRPDKIICIGLNYVDHAAESGMEVLTYPTVFTRFSNSLIGDGAPLIRPAVSDLLDYEAELVAVVGKGGRHIRKEDALEHIAGYSLFNDASVRDYQMKTTQFTMGKTFDGTGAFGPELVTSDELPDGCKGLRITMRVDGELVQNASTDDLIFDVAELVRVLSEVMTLAPGDVIVTGTPSGVGALRKPPLWLKPGHKCVVEVDKIGRLTNSVRQEADA